MILNTVRYGKNRRSLIVGNGVGRTLIKNKDKLGPQVKGKDIGNEVYITRIAKYKVLYRPALFKGLVGCKIKVLRGKRRRKGAVISRNVSEDTSYLNFISDRNR